MPVYRAYSHPDNPAVYRVLGLDAQPEDVKYSRELKTACLLGAGPQPPAPPICPRCHDITTFESRLCYKYGLAGAWNMICQKCKQVHIPSQIGPTEHDLEGMEAIRDRDRQVQRARKEAKAAQSAVKKPQKGKKGHGRATKKNGGKASKKATEHSSDDAHAVSGAVPLGMISNEIELRVRKRIAPTSEGHAEYNAVEQVDNGTYKKAGTVENQDRVHPTVIAPTRKPDMDQRSPAQVEALEPDVRIIVLVLWEQDMQRPFIDRISIPSRDLLFLFHHPRVRAIPPPTQFERYVFKANVWSPVPWDISPIEVCREDDVIFVRVMGVRCRGFGDQLHDYQLKRGQALPLPLRLANIIHDPPERHRWILNDEPPKAFLLDCTLFDNASDDARVPRPWLEILRDAPFLMIWHELQSRWHGFFRDKSPQIPGDAPIVLLAHPGVETLVGSGEAIAWLESWRGAHALTAQEVADTRAARDATPVAAPLSDRATVSPRTYSKKRRMQTTLATNGSPSINMPPARSAISNGVGGTFASSSVAHHAPVIIISDEEDDFVEGSSATFVTPKKRRLNEPEMDAHGRAIIDLT